MKLLTVISLTTALLATPVLAQDDKPATCEQIAELGGTIMSARQRGVDMVKMMNAMGDAELFRQMVIMAYEKPRFNSPDYKREQISEFKNLVYRECLTATSDEL